MPKEERLSAVAKRRRLNGNISSAVNTPSDTSRAQSPAKISVKEVEVPPKTSSNITKNIEQDGNSFSALVNHEIVQFSNFREIEHLNDRAIKVRLSKGSKCIIIGRYGLWIKEGVVEILGARLQASLEIHHVFSSPVFDVPPIVALTDSAEFEVHSCSDETPLVFGPMVFEWTSLYSDEVLRASFYVQGYSNLQEQDSIPNVREFDGSGMADAARKAGRLVQVKTQGYPSILLCGKQSNGAAMLITNLMNHIMTAKHDTKLRQSGNSVVLLDLDLDTPLFAPPGNVSLVRIQSPALGAPFTHPGSFTTAGQKSHYEVLKLYYIDRAAHASSGRHQLDLLLMFLDYIKQISTQNFTLIVRTNNWIESMNPDHVATVTNRLDLDLVICSSSDMGPNTAQLRQIVHTQSGFDAFLSVTNTASKDPALHVQHQLLLQSYFHFRGNEYGCPQWNVLALACDNQYLQWLTYGKGHTSISRIFVPDMRVGSSDMIDALDNCIVALTLQDSEVTNDSSSSGARKVRNGATTSEEGTGETPQFGAECIGLGIVAGFDREKSRICLLTPVSTKTLEFHKNQGRKIELIVQRSDLEGRFDTGWLQLEGDTAVVGKHPAKSLYRHSLGFGSR